MKTLKPQPSPKHRLYAKIRKPSVLRWIRPDADPSPEVWMLAQEPLPNIKAFGASVLTSARLSEEEAPVNLIPPKETKTEATDSLKDIPEIPAKTEAKPKAAPKKPGRKPKATTVKKSETKTEDTK